MKELKKHKLFRVNQAAIIKNSRDQVLILQRFGRWVLPGGRLEEDMSSNKGLSREIKEETGIVNCTIEGVIDIRLSESRNTYMVTFLCYTNKKTVKLSDEHMDYAWVGKNELDKYKFEHKDTKNIIKKVY